MNIKNSEEQLVNEENKKGLSRLIIRPASKIIEDDPNSFESVISNLPLTIFPSLARIPTFESQFSR